MGLAAKDVVDGKISLGDLVAINAYIVQLYSPLSTKLLECLFPPFLAEQTVLTGWLGGAYRMIVQAFTDLEKMFEIFDEKVRFYSSRVVSACFIHFPSLP